MPARLAFPFIYRHLTRGMDEDARLRVDDILGDPSAAPRIDRRRAETVAMSGFEVG